MSPKKVLFIVPDYSFIYNDAVIKNVVNRPPLLSLAMIGGALLTAGHQVKICDLNIADEQELVRLLDSFQPDYAGITFTSPLAEEAGRLAGFIKKQYSRIIVIAGGPHASALPEEVLETTPIDIVCIGESEEIILNIVNNEKPPEKIEGIAFKCPDGSICRTPPAQRINNLDALPYPAWHLYNLSLYSSRSLLSRANLVGPLETSRGCPHQCVYCNKNIFGYKFRTKSVSRVINEIKLMLDCGFKEIHIMDDCFSFDLQRAKEICRAIISCKMKVSWVAQGGLRADSVDYELLKLMKKSGCYRLSMGIETGSDEILKLIKKGETVAQIKKAVKLSKKAGLEVMAFFMLALPGETESSMKQTIHLAKELNFDLAKVSITVPLPGTAYFNHLARDGKIKKTGWSKYNFCSPARDIYDHPNLDWDVIETYYKKFYREFYFRPQYVIKRFFKDLSQGLLLDDI
ncbi:MAG: radical SAM protein, partial [Planctomycetota bacterium]